MSLRKVFSMGVAWLVKGHYRGVIDLVIRSITVGTGL